MSEMIERGARHVFDRIQERSPTAGATFDNSIPEAQEELRLFVRWVIEAMREPTLEMTQAGAYCEQRSSPRAAAVDQWRAMIDAALK